MVALSRQHTRPPLRTGAQVRPEPSELDQDAIESRRATGIPPPTACTIGLLDEIIVSIAPVTLGAGAPLLPRRIELSLEEPGTEQRLRLRQFSLVRPPT